MIERKNSLEIYDTETVIVYYNDDDRNEIENGIYYNITADDLNEIKEENLIVFIPLFVSGRSYQERKNDLQQMAALWSYAGSVANWSYSELSEIQSFFEVNARRYGLVKEFKENGII